MKILPIGNCVKTNPIQTQSNPIKANKMPIQTQNEPNQTQSPRSLRNASCGVRCVSFFSSFLKSWLFFASSIRLFLFPAKRFPGSTDSNPSGRLSRGHERLPCQSSIDPTLGWEWNIVCPLVQPAAMGVETS